MLSRTKATASANVEAMDSRDFVSAKTTPVLKYGGEACVEVMNGWPVSFAVGAIDACQSSKSASHAEMLLPEKGATWAIMDWRPSRLNSSSNLRRQTTSASSIKTCGAENGGLNRSQIPGAKRLLVRHHFS